MLENGQMVLDGNKLVVLEQPTKKPETVMRLQFVEQKMAGGRIGIRPTIVRGDQIPVAKVMPKLFRDFTLPGDR